MLLFIRVQSEIYVLVPSEKYVVIYNSAEREVC
jgi:hypothetical protein